MYVNQRGPNRPNEILYYSLENPKNIQSFDPRIIMITHFSAGLILPESENFEYIMGFQN